MNNYVLIHDDDKVCIYYMIKEKSFRVVEKNSRKPLNKLDFGITFLIISILTTFLRSNIFHCSSYIIPIILFIFSVVLGIVLGVRGSNSKYHELLDAREITITKEDILSYSDSIERYWDSVITFGITAILVPMGMFIAYVKSNISIYFMSCLLLSLEIYIFIYINAIHKYKMVKFIRNVNNKK